MLVIAANVLITMVVVALIGMVVNGLSKAYEAWSYRRWESRRATMTLDERIAEIMKNAHS